MLDIVQIEDGADLGFADTPVTKAANVLSVQLGDLEYAPNFGVDFRFFLQEQMQFQNESFKAYLVERLAFHQINTTGIQETIQALFSNMLISVEESSNARGFIA